MCAHRKAIYISMLHWFCAQMDLDMRNACPSRVQALRSVRAPFGDALRYSP